VMRSFRFVRPGINPLAEKRTGKQGCGIYGTIQAQEPLAKVWADKMQSHFEWIFRLDSWAWWFHVSKFSLQIR